MQAFSHTRINGLCSAWRVSVNTPDYCVQGKTQSDISAGKMGEGQTVMAMMANFIKSGGRQSLRS